MLQGCLRISVLGGYGWFIDDIDIMPMGFLDPSSRPTFLFCHDCVAIMWRMFPVFSRLFGMRGQHPWVGDIPCCEWGYRMIRDGQGVPVAVEYGDGSVVPYRLEGIVASMIDEQGASAATWSSAPSEAVPLTLDVLQRERERIARLIDEDTSGG